MKKSSFLKAFFVASLLALIFNQSERANSTSQDKLFKENQNDKRILAVAQSISLRYLAGKSDEYDIKPNSDLQTKNIYIDELSMAHTKFQQTHEGIPVFGGEIIVHLNSDGSLFTITDSLVGKINVDTNVAVSEQGAIEKAIKILGCNDCLTAAPKVDMFVLRHKGKDYLTYRVQLERLDGSDKTGMPVYFIDAHSGKKVWGYNNLQTASVTSSGTSTYYGNVSFTAYQSATTFYMEDVTRRVGTFDYQNTMSSLSRAIDTDNVWNAANQRAMVDVQYGVSKAYDYFKNVHGRNGINGTGGPAFITSIDGVTGLITSGVHYGNKVNNAFWDPNNKFLSFGDGDGTNFSSFTTLDLCGHELTHGVTQFTAGLTYAGESGALNESMSDVFGVMIDRYVRGESTNTYRIGEECYTPTNGNPNDALRYMDNPHLAISSGFTTDDDPDHYSERYTGALDSGGVHINSGIANKAFHLVAKGGSHHLGGSMVGIGADAAAAIWYKALTTYMTSSTNFAGARVATLNAATVLYGQNSTQYNTVAQAWNLVGVNLPTTSKDTVGLYISSTSAFNLRNTNTAGQPDLAFGYGAANAGWIPIAGDWNGDGIDTIGLYAPTTATFYLRNSNTGGVADITFSYGAANAGWIPIAGDWNGDGIDTIGLYNPTNSIFYLRNSNTGGVADITFSYGAANSGLVPITGDWNSDGIDTIGLYYPAIVRYDLRNSNTGGIADISFTYGGPNRGLIPLAGDFDGNGTDTVGAYEPSTAKFYLRNSNAGGVADITFAYGQPNLRPLIGNWDGR